MLVCVVRAFAGVRVLFGKRELACCKSPQTRDVMLSCVCLRVCARVQVLLCACARVCVVCVFVLDVRLRAFYLAFSFS